MATLKQQGAVKAILDNTGISVGRAMRKVGYGEGSIHNPDQLTDSIGFKEEMARYGLTEELISSSLVDDIEAKPKRRVEELKLGANILRMTGIEAKTSPQAPKNELHIHFHKHQQIKDKYEKELEQALKGIEEGEDDAMQREGRM